MRCTCQVCGTYMVQDEKGILSRCICPNCFAVCNACLGTEQRPLSPQDLAQLYQQRRMHDASFVSSEPDPDPDSLCPEQPD